MAGSVYLLFGRGVDKNKTAGYRPNSVYKLFQCLIHRFGLVYYVAKWIGAMKNINEHFKCATLIFLGKSACKRYLLKRKQSRKIRLPVHSNYGNWRGEKILSVTAHSK